MPTFTTIALDRLLEPGASKSMAVVNDVPDLKLERRKTAPNSKLYRAISVPNSRMERDAADSRPEYSNGTSTVRATTMNKKHHWAQPALYATPESTSLPDSPSSFPPSPYIINHKRRGPRLSKSFSEDDVANHKRSLDGERASEDAKGAEAKVAGLTRDASYYFGQVADSVNNNNFMFTIPSPAGEENVSDVQNGAFNGSIDNGFAFTVPGPSKEKNVNGVHNGELKVSDFGFGSTGLNTRMKSVTSSVERDAEADDFFDPHDSMSVKSNTEADFNSGVERLVNLATPMAEFYDAWEELSSEYGPQHSPHDIEAELHEIRLSLFTEIEKRKQAEEALNNMQSQWLRILQQLSLVGLTLPADPVAAEDGQQDDPVEELCQQVYLAQVVSNAIGRGIARAEVEMEMEAHIEPKNFEISRLLDRLHYYEAVNHEMSQRNQEAVEIARRLRQRRKRRQRWYWGSIAAAITLGAAVLAWSYLPTGKGSSFSYQSHAPDGDHTFK